MNLTQNLGDLVHGWVPFLEIWYLYGWYFKFPSGTPLPKPKLSYPPPPSGAKQGLVSCSQDS